MSTTHNVLRLQGRPDMCRVCTRASFDFLS